jgi:acyl carrier protein
MAKNVEARLRECLLAVTCEAETLPLDTTLRDDLSFDELDWQEFAMELEDEFDLDEIPEAELESWKTIRDALKYVEKQLKASD